MGAPLVAVSSRAWHQDQRLKLPFPWIALGVGLQLWPAGGG